MTDNSDLHTQLLKGQVGGHAGVETTEDGSLLIKPALKREVMFYEEMARAEEGGLARLREYVPKFLGVLRLEGRVVGEKIEPVAGGGGDKFSLFVEGYRA